MRAISKDQGRRVEELVHRHQSSVRGFLCYLGCPAGMLDDLVQEVFLSFLSSRFQELGEASTSAFLRKVARHLFLKAMQRERRSPIVLDAAGAELAWVEFEGEDGGERYLTALRACLARLRGKAAEALGLRYRAGLSQAAIATELALSESGVKSLLVRARRKLRDCVERRLVR